MNNCDEAVEADTTENSVYNDHEEAEETLESIKIETQIDDKNLIEETMDAPVDETNEPV